MRSVVKGIATRQRYESLGLIERDVATDQVAVTDPEDPTVTVVFLPYADAPDEFTIVFVGDLREL